MIAKAVRDFVPKADLLPYIEAILEVYNFLGRRDNKHKARLKILVHEAGIDEVRARIEAAFASKATFPGVNAGLLGDIEAAFAPPAHCTTLPAKGYERAYAADPVFRSFIGSTPTSPRAAATTTPSPPSR